MRYQINVAPTSMILTEISSSTSSVFRLDIFPPTRFTITMQSHYPIDQRTLNDSSAGKQCFSRRDTGRHH